MSPCQSGQWQAAAGQESGVGEADEAELSKPASAPRTACGCRAHAMLATTRAPVHFSQGQCSGSDIGNSEHHRPAGAADSTGQATGKALLLMPPLTSKPQIWSWYVAARTDVESANAELARIEAEFAKFVAAHTKTDAVIEKLHPGQNEAHMHARTDWGVQ